CPIPWWRIKLRMPRACCRCWKAAGWWTASLPPMSVSTTPASCPSPRPTPWPPCWMGVHPVEADALLALDGLNKLLQRDWLVAVLKLKRGLYTIAEAQDVAVDDQTAVHIVI